MLDGRRLTSLAMFAIFAGMAGVAASYPPDARLLPLLVGTTGAVLALVQVIRDLSQAAGREISADRWARREWGYLAWFAAMVAGVVLFGFLVGGPVVVFAFLRWAQGERTVVAAALALLCPAVIFSVFEVLLEIEVFRGLFAALV